MKYLCLIYDNESEWQKFPKEVRDKYMGEYMAFGDSIKKSGQYVGANQLQPSHTATVVRSRNGKVSTTDGPFVSTGRFKAIDRLRRSSRFDSADGTALERFAQDEEPETDDSVEDDRLRLIFTCCHPALSADAQIALTLREVCGLTTEEVAHAFLTPAPTLAQRIVRAKSKIRDAGIPYEIPSLSDLPDRLDSVLHVIYLVFNEGYLASAGPELTRESLSDEAIRLGRLLVELLPEPEAIGLLALMLLHEARRAGRTSSLGDVILLEDYYPAHAARGELCRRLGRVGDAMAAYRRTLELVTQEPERRFLERRLMELGSSP